MDRPKRGEFWRDNEGIIFTITCVALHAETGHEMVVYRNVGSSYVSRYVEPVDDFLEYHTKEEVVLP